MINKELEDLGKVLITIIAISAGIALGTKNQNTKTNYQKLILPKIENTDFNTSHQRVLSKFYITNKGITYLINDPNNSRELRFDDYNIDGSCDRVRIRGYCGREMILEPNYFDPNGKYNWNDWLNTFKQVRKGLLSRLTAER
ncbi:MAG: hypothetical protein ACOYT4_01670 [Nanoarchaeota archaeon]